jgi:hypothetical protein
MKLVDKLIVRRMWKKSERYKIQWSAKIVAAAVRHFLEPYL